MTIIMQVQHCKNFNIKLQFITMIMQCSDYYITTLLKCHQHDLITNQYVNHYIMRQISTNVNLREKRKGTSVDDLKARGKDQIRLPLPNLPFCHWSSQMFDLRAPLSNDVPVMLLNRPIYVFQLGCRNLLEVRNQKFKIQKTTEIISYNR